MTLIVNSGIRNTDKATIGSAINPTRMSFRTKLQLIRHYRVNVRQV